MLENIPKEKILEVVREGPTIPSKIVKRVGGDTMLVGAILSTLSSSGDVCISSLKIGGSPLYYIPDHFSKLEEFTQYLADKDRKAFQLIKDRKVLRDSEQEPLTRVSLKVIRDFAKPFEIDYDGKKELFWRYYLIDKDEAATLAKSLLEPKPAPQLPPEPMQHAESMPKAAVDIKEPATMGTRTEPEIAPKEKVPAAAIVHESKPHKHKSGDFFESIIDFIASKGLDVISKEKVKKSEYTFVLKNHESNEYIYCVAKDKKSVNEGDLSTAFVFAHSKKMPCMFITTGGLTKKAEQMISKEFKDMRFESI